MIYADYNQKHRKYFDTKAFKIHVSIVISADQILGSNFVIQRTAQRQLFQLPTVAWNLTSSANLLKAR